MRPELGHIMAHVKYTYFYVTVSTKGIILKKFFNNNTELSHCTENNVTL